MSAYGDAQARGHEFTACVLLYGDNLPLHQRVLRSVLQGLPASVELRIGLNAVGRDTLDFLSQNLSAYGGSEHPSAPRLTTNNTVFPWGGYWCQDVGFRVVSIFTNENCNSLKYPIMGYMFRCDKFETRHWWLWFDDDSWFKEIDHNQPWSAPAKPGPAWAAILYAADVSDGYFGQPLYCAWAAGQFEWVKQQPWYRGLSPEIVQSGRYGITFAAGGLFGVADRLVKLVDWPPRAMVHNGGDTMLGEALRQQGVHVTRLELNTSGIKVDDGKRRGYSEPPTGSLLWRKAQDKSASVQVT